MLEPEPRIPAGRFALEPLVDAEGEVDPDVAVRVDSDLPAGIVGRLRLAIERLRIGDDDAVVIGPADVGLREPGGPLGDAAVADALHRADLDPLVAQTGPNPGLDHPFEKLGEDVA